MTDAREWQPGRWWRVMRGYDVWCETSDEAEARASMEPGDVLLRQWVRQQVEWRPSPDHGGNDG